jgi:hypothetical protein
MIGEVWVGMDLRSDHKPTSAQFLHQFVHRRFWNMKKVAIGHLLWLPNGNYSDSTSVADTKPQNDTFGSPSAYSLQLIKRFSDNLRRNKDGIHASILLTKRSKAAS